jgi:putative oxidoreductase
VRRYLSNFARGWPAFGLLLIRVVAGAFIISGSIASFHGGTPVASSIPGLLGFGVGALLAAGLWTPFAGLSAAALSLGGIHILHENPESAILLATMGAALTCVGPGAFSVDALLFGLKRIDIGKLSGTRRR